MRRQYNGGKGGGVHTEDVKKKQKIFYFSRKWMLELQFQRKMNVFFYFSQRNQCEWTSIPKIANDEHITDMDAQAYHRDRKNRKRVEQQQKTFALAEHKQ